MKISFGTDCVQSKPKLLVDIVLGEERRIGTEIVKIREKSTEQLRSAHYNNYLAAFFTAAAVGMNNLRKYRRAAALAENTFLSVNGDFLIPL